jgi:F-type H+-transporting ATPase subunit alpha
VRRFEAEFMKYMDNNKTDLLTAIREKKELNDGIKNDLKAALKDFKGNFQNGAKKA